ncbi:MAG: carboxypeptidase regulatory-like domain-containing protein [Opitutae bacterium]|nr:carboxypeptidase regulatory-like domain-containing protein [Opitutae bacterium]
MISSRLLFFAALALALTAPAGAEAVLTGRVVLPKPTAAPVRSQRYEIVTKGGAVATNPPLAVVYLEGVFPPAATPPRAQLAQKDLTFVPSLLPVRAGTMVEFPNQDDTYHNIFSFSPAKRFDLGRYRAEERPVPTQRFDTPGLVTLRCDIHEHMRALILVLDTPHFVLSEPDGRYRLGGLPAGRYLLKVWIDSKTTRERPVELTDGATLTVDFP